MSEYSNRTSTWSTSRHVRVAQKGDHEELAWVVEYFTPFVRAEVRRLVGAGRVERSDADDLVQDAWLVTLRNFERLSPRAGRLTPVLLAYLRTTVAYRSHRHRGRLAMWRRSADAPSDRITQTEPRTGGASLWDSVDARDLSESVARALSRLAPDEREAAILRLIEQRSNEEAARVAGVTAGTMAMRLYRARRRLRGLLPHALLR